jgi:hypothetical protein
MLILSLLLVLLGASLAASQSQTLSVGGSYGAVWLSNYGNKFPGADSQNNLWKWGGAPRGYERVGNAIQPVLAPSQIYYPQFMSNATPVVINATTQMYNGYYLPLDFYSPDMSSDPWMLAQQLERPVIVRYPSSPRSSVLS